MSAGKSQHLPTDKYRVTTLMSRQSRFGPSKHKYFSSQSIFRQYLSIPRRKPQQVQCWRTTSRYALSATILCDSKSALQAVHNPGNKPGQRITYAVLQAATEARTRGITLRLQRIPGHLDDPGNDAADQLAKEAAIPGKTHPFRPLLSREKTTIRNHIRCQWEQEWKSSKKGSHLRKIDSTLPAAYTRRLYGSLRRNRAYLLIQMRAGHSWLATYGKTFGFREDDQCACGAQETVVHVLVDCPLLKVPRQELRKKVRNAYNNASVLLGGSEGKERQVDTASRASTIEAVLDFAEASQRFRSRAPRGQPNSENGS